MDLAEERLLNLHKIILDCQMEDQKPHREPDQPLEISTVRLDPDIKATAMAILERHGVTASQFIRKCLERLVIEYHE